MPFQIIRNDITKVKSDAIVNTANPNPIIGSGTDSAIYKAAGEQELLAERAKIGAISPGDAVYTPAFALDAKYIIHTVGPAWVDGEHGEREILHSCYKKSLELAAELSCESIAFPLIAAGVYGFPKGEALQIALMEINRFLLTHDMEVILVVFDRKAFELSGKLVSGIQQYIDDYAVLETRQAEYSLEYGSRTTEERMRIEAELARYHSRNDASVVKPGAPVPAANGESILSEEKHLPQEENPSQEENLTQAEHLPQGTGTPEFDFNSSGMKLDDVLNNAEDTFQQRLFKLIDASGMDDVTVYKKANIDRKVFSKIRSNVDYHPKKKTAVAFAIALELDLPQMQDLLSRAEIAFSPSNKFDLIITYFITNQIYDIYEINAALFQYGQPCLG